MMGALGMTLCLALNSNNDIYIDDDGNLATKTGVEATAIACGTIAKTQLGEMIFENTRGLPNFQNVWVGTPNLKIWESYLRNMLLNVTGVKEVQDITIYQLNNTLNFKATIVTNDGIITIG